MAVNNLKIILTIVACMIGVVAGIAWGSVHVPFVNVFGIIGHVAFGLELPGHIGEAELAIVWSVRLPRAVLAFLAGAALSLSGAIMQSVLRNPLASSYTLGVSSGASLGAALVIFLGLSLPIMPWLTIPVAGFTLGLGTIVLVLSASTRLDTAGQNFTVILVGMILSLFINAITTLLFSLFGENVQRMVFWQMGSFSLHGWNPVLVLSPLLAVGLVLVWRASMELDILTFGEEQAEAAGVDALRVKRGLLLASAALTGSTISFIGVVGFVDLVAPHIVRKMFGASHRVVVPMSALVGGSFMVLCDLAARTLLAPIELPVGAVTATLGAPFFAYIYFTNRGVRVNA